MKLGEKVRTILLALVALAFCLAAAAECGTQVEEGRRAEAAGLYLQCVEQYSFRATCTDCSWPTWTWEDVEVRCHEISGFAPFTSMTPTNVDEYREEIEVLRDNYRSAKWELDRDKRIIQRLEEEARITEESLAECNTDRNNCCP